MNYTDRLIFLIQNNCTLEAFIERFNTIDNFGTPIEKMKQAFLLEWIDKRLFLQIIKFSRTDILNYLWNFGCHFDIFKPINSATNQNFFDIADKKMKDFILEKCKNLKLFTDINQISKMDNKSLLCVHAKELREFLNIKAFHQSNRDKLEKFCNEFDFKYACLEKKMQEFYFYGRFLIRMKKNIKEDYQMLKDFVNSKLIEMDETEEEFENRKTQNYIKWFNTITFANEPILSKHCIIFIKKDFDVNLLKQDYLKLEK